MFSGAATLAKLIANGEIKLAIFDLDGTMYESRAGVEQQLRPLMVQHTAQVLDIGIGEARALLAGYRERYKSSILGLAEHHDVDPQWFYDEMYAKLDLGRMVARSGLQHELDRLAGHLRLGIFTNSTRRFTHRVLERLGHPAELFTHVITVEDNGFIRKPEVEAYHGMFRHVGLHPERIVMFDDIASSLRVLSGLGSRSILVGNGLRPAPHFVDLHTDDEFAGSPSYVHDATHDLVAYLAAVNAALSE